MRSRGGGKGGGNKAANKDASPVFRVVTGLFSAVCQLVAAVHRGLNLQRGRETCVRSYSLRGKVA